VDLSQKTKEEEETRAKMNENKRGKGDGAPSFYLTGLLYNLSFVPRYF
jgi:hypothetical protein